MGERNYNHFQEQRCCQGSARTKDSFASEHVRGNQGSISAYPFRQHPVRLIVDCGSPFQHTNGLLCIRSSYSFSEAAYSQSGNESSSSVNRRNTSIIDTPYRALSARASTMGTETSPRGGAFLPKDSARAAAAWDADEAQYQQIAAKLPRIDDDDEIVSAEEDLVARVVDFATQGVPSGHASPQDSADEAEWQESARLDGVAHEHRSPARRAAERQFAHMADEEDPLGPDEEAPENESPEQATQRQTRMLARLVTKDLVWGHGCGKKEHLIADEAHRAIFETGGIAHTHISKTYTTATPLQPPKDSDTPGLHNQQDIASVGDVSVPGVNDRTLQQSMEGALGGQDQRPPRHICVHSDDNRNTKGQNVWDIDSWIALPRTFSSLKAGIECKRYSRLPDIISSDLHIRTLAYRQDRPVSEEPRYIPHLHIGNLRSVDHVSVYMFFPHMELEHRVFNGLTEVDTAMFFDDLFFPSADVPPDVAQHFAQGHAAVKMNSLARAKESNNTGVTGSAVGERSLLGIESMKDMDTRMQDRIKNNPALTKFKEFYLFIDAKNIKTAHKHSHSLYHSMDAFEAHIKTHLDLHAMEEIYFDIGKEFTPAICKSAGAIFDEVPADPRAHVFLHKTCCLMSTKKTFVEKAFVSSPGIAVKWTHSFLRDVGGLNLTPPKRSPAYRKGLRYSQWYNVYKELFDAQKTFPFQHKQFTQLAKGNLVQTMVAQGNGGNTKIAAALSASYQHSRLRVANSLVKSQDKPYGARVEHRVGLKLFWAIKDEAEKIHNAECDCLHTNDDGSSSPAGSMFADIRLSRLDINTPSSLWAIPSATYMAFLAGNFDKLLRAYETGIRTADQYVSKERCKVLWVLLVALSHFQSADTKRPSVLWPNEQESAAAKQRRKKKGKTKGNPSRREVGESTLPFQDVDEVLDTETDDTHEALSHGLGLAENIEKYGYGWFLPRIDWKEWKILPEYEKTFLAFFADSQKGKGGHLNVARDNLDVIRMYGKLWPEYKGHPYAQEIIVECMALAVLRQYRFDIVQHLRKSNNPPNSTLEMEDYDSIKFSWDNVKTSFLKRHVVVRSGGQVHARDQKTMILWLFGPGLQANITVNGRPVELRRKNFVESPFRVAYDLVRKILFGFVAPAAFDHYFREIFFRYHWVVPYPDAGGSLSGTGKSDMGYARRWWVASPHDEFLTDHPRSGLPPPPPKYSEYDEVELRKKLNSKKLKSLGKPKRD